MVLAEVSPAIGPMVVVFTLLVASGFEKLERPAPTALALARAGLRVPDWSVRALGVAEMVVALAALDAGVVGGTLVAVLFAGFAAFTTRQVLQARATGEVADCGCFGDSSAPVGWTHVAVNVAIAAAGAATAVVDAAPLRQAGWSSGLAVFLVGTVAGIGVRGLLTDLPRVQALRRAADA